MSDRIHPSIHPSAVVDPGAELAGDVVVGPHATIGSGVVVGAGTQIGAGAVVQGPTRRTSSLAARRPIS
jgi:UDP-N-acetylglucosamine acyltransferase